MDPITAGLNAFGDVASGVLNLFGLNAQKKIVQQQGSNLKELTTQERIKYDELISSGNFTLASQLLASKQSKTNSSQMTTYIILGFTFLIVLVIIYAKVRRK